MGYIIRYGGENTATQKKVRLWESLRFQSMTAFFLALFILAVGMFWKEGTETMKSWLIPGEAGVTETAALKLVEDIRSGEPVLDAVDAFCREIFEEADEKP